MSYGSMMSGHYDPVFVAVSILIAVLSAYAALDLAGRVTTNRGRSSLAWLGSGAVAMGIGTASAPYAFAVGQSTASGWQSSALGGGLAIGN